MEDNMLDENLFKRWQAEYIEWKDNIPPFTIPLHLSHPHFSQIIKDLNISTPYYNVQRAPRYPIGSCYHNVSRHIAANGGSMVLGWQVDWWPPLYVSLMHHAIWRSPTNTLLDLTYGDAISSQFRHISFIEDGSITIDLTTQPWIAARHLIIFQEKWLFDYCRIHEHRSHVGRKLHQALHELGFRVGEDGIPTNIEPYLKSPDVINLVNKLAQVSQYLDERGFQRLMADATPRIDPDKPCRCGSGFRYRNCHALLHAYRLNPLPIMP